MPEKQPEGLKKGKERMWGYVRGLAAVTYLHFELGMWYLGVFDSRFRYVREEH